MKRITIFFLSLLWGLFLVPSCFPDANLVEKNDFDKVTMTAHNFVPEGPATKTSLTISETEGAVFSWKAGDIVGVYPDVGTQVRFPIIENLGANTSSARFTGGGWAVKGAHSYMAYYPFISDMELDKEAVPVDYTGQVQVGVNGSTDHLSNFDYMAAAASAPSDGEIAFDFKHLGALLMINLTVPKIAEYDRMILTCDDVPFITKGTVDITADVPAITGTEWSNSFVVNLNNFSTTQANQPVSVIAMIAPVDMSGNVIRVRLEGSHAYCETTFTRGTSKPFLAGVAYRPTMDQDPSGGSVVLLEQGDTFNTAIKTLANGEDFGADRYDHMIKHLVIEANAQIIQVENGQIEINSTLLPVIDVSDPESSDNIYAIWNSSTFTLTLQTPADKLYMNHNAQGMFSRLEVLEDITGIEYLSSEYTTNMISLFNECRALKAIDLSHLNMSREKSMGGMFSGCASLTSLDLSGMDTSRETSFAYWFSGCTSLRSITFGSSFSTASAQSMFCMFANCTALESIDLSGFDTSNVTSIESMFTGCASLTAIDISSFDGSEVLRSSGMFEGCTNLQSLDLSTFITPKNSDMNHMFADCSSLTSITFGANYDTHNVESFDCLFTGCRSIEEIDMSMFRTPNLRNMFRMFSHFTDNLKRIDMRNFDTSNCLNFTAMFYITGCQLEELILGRNFVIRDDAAASEIFGGLQVDKIVCTREIAERWTNDATNPGLVGWTRFDIIDETDDMFYVDTFSSLNEMLNTVTDGTIHLMRTVKYDMYLPEVTVNLNGKTIIAEGGLAFNFDIEGDRTVNFSGTGTVKQPDDYDGSLPLMQINHGRCVFNGGTFISNSSSVPTIGIGMSSNDPTIEIKGGVFKNLATSTNPLWVDVSGLDQVLTISGGTFFNQDPSTYVDQNTHQVIDNSDGSYSVVARQ